MIWRLLVGLGLFLAVVLYTRAEVRSVAARVILAVFVLSVVLALGLAAGSHVTDEFRAAVAAPDPKE